MARNLGGRECPKAPEGAPSEMFSENTAALMVSHFRIHCRDRFGNGMDFQCAIAFEHFELVCCIAP